jgi:SAM-dependent methyltransferase
MGGRLSAAIDRRFYAGYHDRWDDRLFRDKIMEHIDAQTLLLDVGAGAGVVKEMNFRGLARAVYGVDPDERVLANDSLDERHVGYGNQMPFFEDSKFDLVISNNVLEHLRREDIYPFFREVKRVLKPEGLFLTKTPNKFHYVPVLSRLTPTWFHRMVNRTRGMLDEDTFPTCYMLNTAKEQRLAASRTGFRVRQILFFEGRPEYMRITPLSYICGMLYERAVNRLNLDRLKVVMITTFEKEKPQEKSEAP